jgi:predicted outer membrane repeat protein
MGLPDAVADRVLGQAAFNTNSPGTSATTLNGPAGIATTPLGAPGAGRLFVVDYGNHRLLGWPSAASFTSGQAADLVIGQANFATGGRATDQNRFSGPEAASVDSSGRLWVADTENSRILRFDPPFSNGMNASLVLGQPDFLSGETNQGGEAAANTLYFPRGLALDGAGQLYVADDSNHRVLRFSPPFETNMDATLVVGQENFVSNSPNRGVVAWQNTLNHPKGVAVDGAGQLYVADYDNNRVLRYAPPLGDGQDADGVFGQPDYATTTANQGGIGAGSLSHPVDLAISAAGDALFVTDQANARVLGYANPLAQAVADQVYGQPNFTSATPNNGGVSATSLNEEPLGVAVDANGSLFQADYRNHRLLAYDADVVGNGTLASCTEAALETALAWGGAIRFNCGPGTAYIPFTGQKQIYYHTTIDGGHTTVVDGQDLTRLFWVTHSLTLRNITLTRGYFDGDGGAIRNNGTLVLENTTIRNSRATASGGAILSFGPLTMTNSLLQANQALNGGALYPRFAAATTKIINSVLRDNWATSAIDGWGGAILAWDGAPVTVEGSYFYNNTAREGGAIYHFGNGDLILHGSTWLDFNHAVGGGGLYNYSGTVELTDVIVSRNTATSGGGLLVDGVALLTDVTVRDNVALNRGGGLYHIGGLADLRNVTLSGNRADDRGGALYTLGGASVLYLTNATVSGNSAGNYGGGLFNDDGLVTLGSVTLSGNSAGTLGGAIFNSLGSVTVEFTIVADSPAGGNCFGGVTSLTPYSLSSDASCGFNPVPNVLLGPLANNGGPTKTHMPLPGSPAIDYITIECPHPATDQRGAARPVGSACDVGAVEFGAKLPWVYVPVLLK